MQQLTTLYETDFAQWIDKTAELLRQQKFAELDLDNLIEEVESLGRRDKRELRSRLIVLLAHLLKYAFQPEQRSSSWTVTVNEQRRQILLILEDSPSLRNYFSENLAECYTKARNEAVAETGLSITSFPRHCPFTAVDVLTEQWLP